MGNCMKTRRSRQEVEEEEIVEEIGEATEFVHDEKENNDIGIGKGSIKVKIVLTKEEVELLLMKLKHNNGKSCLEDLLAEMERASSSGKVVLDSWRPSLESIMEEVEDDRS